VEIRNEAGGILVEMSDTGPGLPDDIRRNLFTPCRSTKSGGTGLGLAISRQLAQHMGGELTLARTSSSGTVFHLRIPERVLAPESALT
jgi:signal transduction histidine kinase